MQCAHHFRFHIRISLILCALGFYLRQFRHIMSVRAFFYVDAVPVPITHNVIYVSQSTRITCALSGICMEPIPMPRRACICVGVFMCLCAITAIRSSLW